MLCFLYVVFSLNPLLKNIAVQVISQNVRNIGLLSKIGDQYFFLTKWQKIKLIIVENDRQNDRQNISISILLHLSTSTEMTSIEPLVENEKIMERTKEMNFFLSFPTHRTPKHRLSKRF